MKVVVKKNDNAIPVAITTEYIKLQDAMKLANAAETGGEAKLMIQEWQILVNGEICRMRGMKPALVSFHIDRLVGEGYLLRQPVPGDRRKTALVLTAQAQPIVAEGRELQRAFADRLAEGLSAEDLAHFRRCVAIFDRNIEQIRAEKSKRTEIQNP